MGIVVFIAFLSICNVLGKGIAIEVETNLGTIIGQTIPFQYNDSHASVNKSIDIFYGIPYAEPPIGNLRFQKTKSKEPWLSPWNSTFKRARCWQFAVDIDQDEDCLFLNIWSPSVKRSALPVMIWIHGGAYLVGSSSNPEYDGAALAAINDVIVVSINYRLAAFGFLYAGDAAKGNYALWDQYEAIKWTHTHITAFGGDPNRITLFGQSAGAGSIGHQLIAKQSWEYFQQAILMSGGMLHPWSIELDHEKARSDAYLVGELSGCLNIQSDFDLIDCLRKKDAQRITLAVDKVIIQTLTVVIPLIPVVDGEFITKDPHILMDQGKYKQCKVMMGTTTDDGTLMGARAYFWDINNSDPFSDYNDFHDRITNYTYTYRNDIILSGIEQQYLDWSNADDATFNHFDTYNAILTDEAFRCPTDKMARIYAKDGNTVYAYLFNYLPEHTVYDIPGVSWPWKGIAHGEDIPFVFGKPFSDPLQTNRTYSEKEKSLSIEMMRYYTNFVKTGNPNDDEGSPCRYGECIEWKSFTILHQVMKSFEIPLQDKTSYRADYCHFWNDYLPKHLVPYTAELSEVERQWQAEFDRWKEDDITHWRSEYESYCEIVDFDECSSSPCMNGAFCEDHVNGYLCVCAAGYEGERCELEINECERQPCKNGGTCTDRINDFECACPDAYRGSTCAQVNFCECQLFGNLHYNTFDGGILTFQGDCEYVVSQHTSEDAAASGLTPFKLIARHHKNTPSSQVAHVSFLRLELHNKSYRLQNQHIFVDDIQVTTPYVSDDLTISLRPNGAIILSASFGLSVELDEQTAAVSLHSNYYGLASGLCGNCDKNSTNECVGNGQTATLCGRKWSAISDCEPALPVDGCLEYPENRETAKDLCSIINDVEGPFGACRHALNLTVLVATCEHDLCISLPDLSILCDHLEHVATVCSKEEIVIANWRQYVPSCPHECPEGTSYNPCGTTCVETCGNERGALEGCSFSCTEVCECEFGQVPSDGICKSREECGCMLPNGGYLKPGDNALVGNCGHDCLCEAGELICQPVSCDSNARCLLKSGVEKCYCDDGYEGDGIQCAPQDTCECLLWGGLHIISFDGVEFAQNGECEYTLLKPLNAASTGYPDFELVGRLIKNSPEEMVSFMREIKLKFQGNVYKLMHDRNVYINDELIPLPYSDDQGVLISSRRDIVLSAEFGLAVIWNNRNGATIKLDKSTYFNNTAGLCGTCNNIEYDEFTLKSGVVTSSSSEFGSSWKTGLNICFDPDRVFVCPAGQQAGINARNLCNAIIDPFGALSICHDLVSPNFFYQACVYDVCSQESSTMLCEHMEMYIQRCSALGGSTRNWWMDRKECEPVCPKGSHYIPHSNGCPKSCQHPLEDQDCPIDGSAFCVCPEGQFLDDEECVHECGGCYLEGGEYLKEGESEVNYDCTEVCTCTNKIVECVPMSCSQLASCSLLAGRRTCICKPGYEGDGRSCQRVGCTCTIWGGSHIITFDGHLLTTHGECEHILVENIETSTLPHYRIIAKNVKDYPSSTISFTRSVLLEIDGTSYNIISDGTVFMNGIQEPLPFKDELVKVYELYPQKIVIECSFNISLMFASPFSVRIKINNDQTDRTLGLCGTCKGEVKDDSHIADGQMVESTSEFEEAWTFNSDNCYMDEVINDCTSGSDNETFALRLCSVLTSPIGPFADCHQYVDPSPFFSKCTADVCAVWNKEFLLCNTLNVYAQFCKEAGRHFEYDWREDVSVCNAFCVGDMTYKPCESSCQKSCASPNMESENCSFRCEEVCQCPDGMEFDGMVCIPSESCGCLLPDGGYIQTNQEWYNEDCSEICLCGEESGLTCQPHQCPVNAACLVTNGKRSCHCDDFYEIEDNTCVTASCTCTVFGDPHYFTFDGLSFDYQGECEYVLVENCNNSNEVPYFKLVGKHNKKVPSDNVSYLKYLRLEHGDDRYEMFVNGRVHVNGIRVNMPYSYGDVDIRESIPGYTSLTLTLGLSVLFDQSHSAEIKVSNRLNSLTCGLCGTCSGNSRDEFLLPNGEYANSVEEFGANYRNSDGCEIEGLSENPCIVDSNEYSVAADVCHSIIRYPGPFAPCFQVVNPMNFYNACVMDVCVTGDISFSCSSMIWYSRECSRNGIRLKRWLLESPHCPVYDAGNVPYADENLLTNVISTSKQRSKRDPRTESDIDCPLGATAVHCGNLDRKRRVTCHNDPVCGPFDEKKVCVCREPMLFHMGECVPNESFCYCKVDGRYSLKSGDTYVSERCEKIWFYTTSDICSYRIYGCAENANCETRSGKHDCYCIEGYSGDGTTFCNMNDKWGRIWGEPHFRSFDGSSFSYHGTCEYTITEYCTGSLDLDYFKVSADFARTEGGSGVSVCFSIRLVYRETSYEIKGTDRIHILVNEREVATTYNDDAVSIVNTGGEAFRITTDFGLKIELIFGRTPFQYYSSTYAYLPWIYEGKVCGLLGDADGNVNDEPPKLDENAYGDSFKTGLSQCNPAERGECQNGTGIQKSAQNMCYGIMNNLETLGMNCHDFEDPERYYESCVFDVCTNMLSTEFMCAAYQEYADTCRRKGGEPGRWWEAVPNCSEQCDSGMVYTDCGTTCPATCRDRNAPQNCDEKCVPTCQCPEGTVLDGHNCTFTHYCGCTLPDGEYIQHGKVHVSSNCSMRCSCDLGEKNCAPMGCGVNEECKILKGIRNCYCLDGYRWNGTACSNEPCRAEIWRRLHVITFDGTGYDFKGDCWYTLITTCNEGDLEKFIVTGDIASQRPPDPVPFLRSIKYEHKGSVYQLFADKLIIKVNDALVSPPYLAKDNSIFIQYVHPAMVLKTYFGLVLTFDPSEHSLDVELSPLYYDAVCGMCGSCNHNSSDDFLLPSGEKADSGSEFGNYWATNDRECVPDPGPIVMPLSITWRADAEAACFILISEGGPYSECHDLVDPYIYHHTCVQDYLVTRDEIVVHHHTKQYAKSCEFSGLSIAVNFIAESCPSDMIYNASGPVCPETCSTSFNSVSCPSDYVKTCTCPTGKVLEVNKCVNPNECGCGAPDGTYLRIGEEFMNENCSQRCVCKSHSKLECQANKCDEHSTCLVKSGQRNCFCNSGYTGNGHQCVRDLCECLVWKESHFQSFDRLSFTFNGGCSYVLLKSYNIVGEKPAFILIGTFQDNNNKTDSYSLAVIRLEYLGVHYEIWRGGTFLVDDDVMVVPFKDGRVSVLSLIGGNLVLTTDFGLSIYYNRGSVASIKINLDWTDMVNGMCGTCNNNPGDDFLMPSGQIADDYIEFANSWLIRDECTVFQPPQPDNQGVVEFSGVDGIIAEDKCFIIADRYGIFSSCHDFLDPAGHYQTCVSDYIQDPGFLCESLASYGARCKAAGGPKLDWRSKSLDCQIFCPEKTSYQVCGTACSPSCADPNGLMTCQHDCIESCSCPYGQLISGNSCVDFDQCNCFLNTVGVLHEGETYVDALCTLRCSCDGQNLTCDEDYRCNENAACTSREGEHRCQCEEKFEGDGVNCTKVIERKDCYDLLQNGATEDGVYKIYPTDWPGYELEVYCDMTTDGGGWTVFHKRYDNSENFYRDWNDYKDGFGHPGAEFWLGNEAIHFITSRSNVSMRVDIVDVKETATYAIYEQMSIESEDENYRLHWKGFSGNVLSNALEGHNLMEFSTFDNDNDEYVRNCAEDFIGAWWFSNCFSSNLNGDYGQFYIWMPYLLTKSEMKIRPRDD